MFCVKYVLEIQRNKHIKNEKTGNRYAAQKESWCGYIKSDKINTKTMSTAMDNDKGLSYLRKR